MADYSILADVSVALLATLRENLCPEPIASPESIALASPNDKNGDFQLGAYLYEIKDLNEYRTALPQTSLNGVRTNPPRPFTLHYMLFVNNKAQMSAGAELEQRILGGAIQTVMDHAVMDLTIRNPGLDEEEGSCAVSLLSLSMEDKSKVWAAVSTPYQLGVYLAVSPVLISSRKQAKVSRVVSAQIDLQHREPHK